MSGKHSNIIIWPQLSCFCNTTSDALLSSCISPYWFESVNYPCRSWIYYPPSLYLPITTQTNLPVVARLLTERYNYTKIQPYSYNCYYFALTTISGQYLQIGPFKSTSYRHRSSFPQVK